MLLENKEPYRSKNVPSATYWKNNGTGEMVYVWCTWKKVYEYAHFTGTVEFIYHDSYRHSDRGFLTVNEFINQYTFVGRGLYAST